ncbi:MAG: 16S rRNA (guanine(966)-N(2))-methyltransferase RsmD [Gammaproteobacteria bacterium]
MRRRNNSGNRGGTRPAGRFRIIGGVWRGRRFSVPAAPGVRPTPDRVRETLFNWLTPVIDGARCLDLYAGSGALGLEALSRGAARVVFVDSSAVACAAIRDALQIVGSEAGDVRRETAESYLAGPPEAFDVVFLDPPFRQGRVEPALQRLVDGGWLRPSALVYIETERHAAPPPGWDLLRGATAGQVRYHLARPEPPADGENQK